MVCELPHIDHRQADRVVGQAGEGLFADAGNPDENIFASFDVQIAIECDNSNVITDRVVGDHPVGFEAHVYIEANLLTCHIATFGEVAGQIGKILLHLAGIHARQPGADAQNRSAAVHGVAAVRCG